ncbi:hypothetical protein EIN_409950 [Entamoeba invadens IP1]|uniref:TLDc domain-containing protein n=1 Tax=Entamoeba invadens IP1 TaxID=370355 RepID=A0A0A1TWU5_ENTIV|nr:hypothetical protein EIN_409950 [Entamoeba invadens IP1]ELP85676.1 hypothetical protein EIN_409950 [Entamoeba invadens IP1]|eukprot:XP_004185022.1 hypothetical protein EIN_409950 [Entamoeba invadens IP1]
MLDCHCYTAPLNSLVEVYRQLKVWSDSTDYTILFDSSTSDWTLNSDQFAQRVLNKQNLFFVVIDENNNIFGGYKKSVVKSEDDFLKDKGAYLFTMNVYGTVGIPLKCVLTQSSAKDSFFLGSKRNSILFAFGKGDLVVYKKDVGKRGICLQCSFDYYNAPVVLCGTTRFVPQRVLVVEMLN